MKYIDKNGNIIEVIPTASQIRAWFYLGSANRKPLTLLRYKDRAAAKLGRELNFDVSRVDWPRKRSANAGGQS